MVLHVWGPRKGRKVSRCKNSWAEGKNIFLIIKIVFNYNDFLSRGVGWTSNGSSTSLYCSNIETDSWNTRFNKTSFVGKNKHEIDMFGSIKRSTSKIAKSSTIVRCLATLSAVRSGKRKTQTWTLQIERLKSSWTVVYPSSCELLR